MEKKRWLVSKSILVFDACVLALLTFANELVANVGGGLGDGTAKLEVVGDVVLTAARRGAEDSSRRRSRRRRCRRCRGIFILVGRRRLGPGGLVGVLGRRGGVLGVGSHGDGTFYCSIELCSSLAGFDFLCSMGYS